MQRCHTMEYMEELKKKDPYLEQRIRQERNRVTEYLNSRAGQKRSQSPITIPVVVHVLHNGEPIGTGKNISTAQILSQIEVLNEDYQARNSDLSNVPTHFTDVIGNAGIEFCLASIDPNGNPTTGINRVDLGANGSWSDNLKPGTIWDATQYLNIWVSELFGGTLGYTTFPGTDLNYDGVVIDYRYLGRTPANPFFNKFNRGRTASHEIGHWLDLDHTFQGGCSGTNAATCSTGGDRICDTPPTQSANYGCSLLTSQNTCTETPEDLPDMWMNFLDYMDDACLFMFTQGQADRMRAVLNTSRSSIRNSIGCQAQNLFSFSGRVIDIQTGQGLAKAKVLFDGTAHYEVETDSSGNFISPNFREGTYAVYAGRWGYMTREFSSGMRLDSGSASLTIPLEKGYYDDFLLDYGWIMSATASSGLWERDFPDQTIYSGSIANPGEDVTDDFGSKCFVTGNGGGLAGNDDVDDGSVTLMSPLFDLTGYVEPYLSYYRWFFNGGGQGNPNDRLTVSISNGIQTQAIETVDASTPNANQWNLVSIRVSDFITPSAAMQLIVEASDNPASAQHIVEAGFDKFQVTEATAAIALPDDGSHLLIYPNPVSAIMHVMVNTNRPQQALLLLMETSGKVILQNTIPADGEAVSIDLSALPKGMYLVKLLTRKQAIVRKVTLIR